MSVLSDLWDWFSAPMEQSRYVVCEDDDEVGYYLVESFRGASKSTKAVLLELLPEYEWDEIRSSALDAFKDHGSYYPDGWSIFHE